ncbi:MAG: hypothetical protein AAGG44_01695 [Planctomycetota bacterium]
MNADSAIRSDITPSAEYTHEEASRIRFEVPKSIAWVGPTSGCFDWIRNQIASLGTTLVDFSDWDEAQQQFGGETGTHSPVQRMLVACENRVELPAQLSTGIPIEAEFPIAIVTGDWWQGAALSGNRQFPLPVFAWARWWDSVLPWILGSNIAASQTAPIRNGRPSLDSLRLSTCNSIFDLAPANEAADDQDCGPNELHGLIAAGNRDAVEQWTLATHATALSSNAILEHATETLTGVIDEAIAQGLDPIKAGHPKHSWILLDDSVFGSVSGSEHFGSERFQCPENWIATHWTWLNQLGHELPCIFATSVPRWDMLEKLSACGWDFLVKPTVGRSLENILQMRLGESE